MTPAAMAPAPAPTNLDPRSPAARRARMEARRAMIAEMHTADPAFAAWGEGTRAEEAAFAAAHPEFGGTTGS